VLGVEKLISSKMMEPGSNRQVGAIDLHVGVVSGSEAAVRVKLHVCVQASTGLSADARQLSNYAHDEAHSYRKFYGAPVPVNVVAKRLAAVAHNYTLHSYMRPFGATAIIGGVDVDGPQLWLVEPSGITNVTGV
jgi:20S proteasome subunit alpha 7